MHIVDKKGVTAPTPAERLLLFKLEALAEEVVELERVCAQYKRSFETEQSLGLGAEQVAEYNLEARDVFRKQAEAAEALLAEAPEAPAHPTAWTKANYLPWLARVRAAVGKQGGAETAETLLLDATDKLQRVRDALKFQANSEGGLVAEVDSVLARVRAAGGKP